MYDGGRGYFFLRKNCPKNKKTKQALAFRRLCALDAVQTRCFCTTCVRVSIFYCMFRSRFPREYWCLIKNVNDIVASSCVRCCNFSHVCFIYGRVDREASRQRRLLPDMQYRAETCEEAIFVSHVRLHTRTRVSIYKTKRRDRPDGFAACVKMNFVAPNQFRFRIIQLNCNIIFD